MSLSFEKLKSSGYIILGVFTGVCGFDSFGMLTFLGRCYTLSHGTRSFSSGAP